MRLSERIHWYFEKGCNLDCSYCFKPTFSRNSRQERGKLELLANILVDAGVKHAILTGGEPTLNLGNLYHVLKILKDANVSVSLHTNAARLDEEELRKLQPYLKDIAIPVDSMNREIQTRLKRVNYLHQFKRVFSALQKLGMPFNLHTVATMINISGIPSIYRFVRDSNFGYWKVYEFNSRFIYDRFANLERYTELGEIEGECTERGHKEGFARCLFARFLLMEEKMKQTGDKRIQFVGVRDIKPPYIFLDNSGDMRFCNEFTRSRIAIGNLFAESFYSIREKLRKILASGIEFDEEGFIESEQDRPVFARLRDGFYCGEEIEEISPKYYSLLSGLYQLYENKRAKQCKKYNRLEICA